MVDGGRGEDPISVRSHMFGRRSGDPIIVLGNKLKLRISQQVSFLVEAFFFLPPSSPRSLTT